MAHHFIVEPAALKRSFSVYVVLAIGRRHTQLYVGKTGDNNIGCNPVISRCGNHFSYNDLHSQIRNKIEKHEDWQYEYIFDHFDTYTEDKNARRLRTDRINEMERWLNQKIKSLAASLPHVELVNEYKGTGYIPKHERDRRDRFRTRTAEAKLDSIVNLVRERLDATTR